jgi:hypothetical protein
MHKSKIINPILIKMKKYGYLTTIILDSVYPHIINKTRNGRRENECSKTFNNSVCVVLFINNYKMVLGGLDDVGISYMPGSK